MSLLGPMAGTADRADWPAGIARGAGDRARRYFLRRFSVGGGADCAGG